MNHRDSRVKALEDRRRRCRSLLPAIESLPWERIEVCDLCGESEIAIIARADRYNIPLQAGMCLNCGLIFLLDRLTLAGYAQFYQDYYRPLVSLFWNRSINAASIQSEQAAYASRLISSIKPWLKTRATGAQLLDIGGSTGVVAELFVRAFGYQGTVMDPATDELRVAERKGLRILEGALETYDVGIQKFDLVLLCQTIDHLFELRNSLKKVRTLIKEGGLFFVDIVDFDVMCFLMGGIESALHIDHCFYLSQETARWAFPVLGWQVVHANTAMQSGHVGFLLKRSSEHTVTPPPDASTCLRRYQQLEARWHIASQQTYGFTHWMRKRAYRAKQYLSESRNS